MGGLFYSLPGGETGAAYQNRGIPAYALADGISARLYSLRNPRRDFLFLPAAFQYRDNYQLYSPKEYHSSQTSNLIPSLVIFIFSF
jgi:hypothetical protein